VCAREGGANTTSFQAAHFVLRNTPKTGGYDSQADGFITADEHFFIALARLKRGKLPWLVL